MPDAIAAHASLDDWVARDAVPFDLGSPASVGVAVDWLLSALGGPPDLLGLGEPMHGGEEFLALRNRLFERLVEAHGYTAIALESSFPRGRLVNRYIVGDGAWYDSTTTTDTDAVARPASYDAVQDAGFSHQFGRLAANRELVEWMRRYNADPTHRAKLRFYGFDSPTEMMTSDSPRALLRVALDYLASVDGEAARDRRERIDQRLGDDADWETPAAAMDPAKSVGGSPAAVALRAETEDLITELAARRPDLVPRTGSDRYTEAERCAAHARQMLTYHAAVARPSPTRVAGLLGVRDLMMADNLAYAVAREQARGGHGGPGREGRPGKVLAFAHNSHLKAGQATWQLGPTLLKWWPAGAHLRQTLGPRYAVVGGGVGTSAENGIGPPEPGTLEACLTAAAGPTAGPARFVPTHGGQRLPADAVAALPTRFGSTTNPTYFPLTPQSLADFDGLVVFDGVTYNRGGLYTGAAAGQ